jgi:hypothetical protein
MYAQRNGERVALFDDIGAQKEERVGGKCVFFATEIEEDRIGAFAQQVSQFIVRQLRLGRLRRT